MSILFIMIGSSGCNSRVEKNEFIEKVKVFETNEIKLDDLQITYDEFKENLNGIFTPKYEKYYLENKDKRYLLSVEGKDLRMKDIENINEEAFEEYQRIIEESSKEEGIQKIDSKIEISDADYEGVSEGEKRVYSRITRTIYFVNKDPAETLIFKRYDFKKIDDEWKISKIKKSQVNADRNSGKALDIVLAYTAFTPENNSKIKYVESVSFPLQLQ